MNVFRKRHLALAVALLVIGAIGANAQQERVAHPNDLTYPELTFEPPNGLDHRHELANGAVAYVVEDHELPLVSISLTVRTGSYTAPAQATPGVAGLTGSQLRSGGTASLAPADFDEELDFLAANMGSGFGATSGSASFNCLTKDLERCIELFFEMLREPRFDAERLELAKSQRRQAMEQRNDSTAGIEGREWNRLMYGNEHFSTRALSADMLAALTSADLTAFHGYAMHPGNFIFAVSGDVDTAAIVDVLNGLMADWPTGETAGAVAAPDFTPTPGLYLVHKEDVNQGRVSIGHLGTQQGNPDRFALQIMNDILGGGGFTSRIMSRVRSDEGLAYSAGSGFGFGIHYDGSFRAFFQSRSEAVARASAIVIDEIERIRNEPVSAEELATSKASFIESFTRNFASAAQVAGLFASFELQGRDFEYLASYRDNMAAVTADDVLRVAREYLHPERLVILAVGNVDDMLAGDPENPEITLADLAPGANITRIPLPDPLTMQYPEQ
jgi:predicted Zn-dependent peptidase